MQTKKLTSKTVIKSVVAHKNIHVQWYIHKREDKINTREEHA